MTAPEDLRLLAARLKALPIEQDPDPEPGSNLLSYTFRRKLVAADVQDAHLSIAYSDYLKALAAVDYFVHVPAGETRLLDNLRYIVDQARARNPRPMLTLSLILVESGLRLRELPEDLLRSADVRRRYDARDAAPDPAALARPAEPFYLALAALLVEQVDAGRRPPLTQAATRQAIKAVLFTDAVLQLGPVPEAEQALAAGDPFAASIAAAGALRTLATPQLLQQHLEPVLTPPR
jgi:hypothetical protein